MSWTGYLTRGELRDVRKALIAAGMSSRDFAVALLAVLPEKYRKELMTKSDLSTEALVDHVLKQMNEVVNLKGGEVPLKLLLHRAADFARDPEQRNKFEEMEAKIDLRRPSRAKPAAAPRMAGPAPFARAVAEPDAGFARLRAIVPSPADAELTLEATIGDFDETLPVDFLAAGLKAANSVFKIVVHRHFDGEPAFNAGDMPDLSTGTAWMFGPGIAITNHHVFNARTELEGDAEAEDFALQAATARVIEDYWDDSEEPAGHEVGAAGFLYSDRVLDFALFRVPAVMAGRPPLNRRRHPIRKNEVQRIGDRVNLLQHPMGRPLRLGFRNNFVVLGNNDVLAYLTDTNRGSSGAPVLDDKWSVAALHVGSQKISVPGIALMGTEIRRENFGVPVRTILSHVEEHAPDIFAEITGT